MNIDYKNIQKIIGVQIYPFDSRDTHLINFELVYNTAEGNQQRQLCPTYASSIASVIDELKDRNLISSRQSQTLDKKLKSLNPVANKGTHRRHMA